jgi:hypothetical protein
VSAKTLAAPNDAHPGCVCATIASRLSISPSTLSDRVVDRALEIANRLRFVCADMAPEELIELATQMALVELKYACVEDAHVELECV